MSFSGAWQQAPGNHRQWLSRDDRTITDYDYIVMAKIRVDDVMIWFTVYWLWYYTFYQEESKSIKVHICVYTSAYISVSISIYIYLCIYIHKYRLHMSKISFHRPQPLPKSKTYCIISVWNCLARHPLNVAIVMWNHTIFGKSCGMCPPKTRGVVIGRVVLWGEEESCVALLSAWVDSMNDHLIGETHQKRNDSKSLNWKKIHLPNLESQWSQG